MIPRMPLEMRNPNMTSRTPGIGKGIIALVLLLCYP